MPGAPLIGLTTSITVGVVPERVTLNTSYVRAVQAAGGVPVLLPPGLDPAALDVLWSRLDGLVLTGGGDVDPRRFGQAPHPSVAEVSAARDDLELDLTARALAGGRPLLAICRGVQVLNVARGGSLEQDLPTARESARGHAQTAPRDQPTHAVQVEAGSALGETLGRRELAVNSFHHQAIDRLGEGLRAVAWSPDGVIEGVEVADAAGLVLAVQWHPEDLVARDESARRLFEALVAAARGAPRGPGAGARA